MAFTYILECCDGSYYVGSTTHLERRLTQHSSGGGSEFTRRRLPVRLSWFCEFASIRDAYELEKKLHGWSHPKRTAFIEGRFADLPALASSIREVRVGAVEAGRQPASRPVERPA